MDSRFHDLDALRAFAMLMGIVVHATLSFIPGLGLVWGVQDSQASHLYGVVLSAIHGWRMPLFFLVSGFFTAMLWKKRGIWALIIHRFQRIFVPMMLALVTIIPLQVWLASYVRSRGTFAPTPAAEQKKSPATNENRNLSPRRQNPDDLAQAATDDRASLTLNADRRGVLNVRNEQKTTAIKPKSTDSFPWLSVWLRRLFYYPVFHHLWFLSFLCWFVCGFVLVVKLIDIFRIPTLRVSLLTSNLRYIWLIGLTAVSQYFMGANKNSYGPDTSLGLLPLPAVFVYYVIFFAYGALYFGAADTQRLVGRGFSWKLPVALLLLFPAGLILRGPETTAGRILFTLLQVSYAWFMSFAMIGLFHYFFSRERRWIRYLSDSSYWLYLAHMPVVMYCQFLISTWIFPSGAKFLLLCGTVTLLLLISYQFAVRNTWIGRLLNGPRMRASSHASAVPPFQRS